MGGWPTQAELSMAETTWSISAECGPMIARVGSNSTSCGRRRQNSTRVRPCLANLGRFRLTRFRPCLGRLRPNLRLGFGHIWTALDRIGPKLTNIGRHLSNSDETGTINICDSGARKDDLSRRIIPQQCENVECRDNADEFPVRAETATTATIVDEVSATLLGADRRHWYHGSCRTLSADVVLVEGAGDTSSKEQAEDGAQQIRPGRHKTDMRDQVGPSRA